MSTYTVGEVADRSGFSASALRYYDEIGLVSPTSRSAGGYRLYGDDALARLAFIAGAKQLGCSLEEITDLVSIREGQRCDPVQRRLHELVTNKITDARRQIDDLTAFAIHLEDRAAQLTAPAIEGPCAADCACLSHGSQSDALPQPQSEPAAPPVTCSLEAVDLADRLDQWRVVLSRARSRTTLMEGPVRIEFGDDQPIVELVELAAAEQKCCAFFSFAITIDGRGVALELQAPPDADAIITSLLAEP